MHPKQQGIHALRLNRSSNIRCLFKPLVSGSVLL